MGKLNSLKICHVNIRSPLCESRLIELEILCAAQQVDVLRISETWLSPFRAKAGTSLIDIPGFQPPFDVIVSTAAAEVWLSMFETD